MVDPGPTVDPGAGTRARRGPEPGGGHGPSGGPGPGGGPVATDIPMPSPKWVGGVRNLDAVADDGEVSMPLIESSPEKAWMGRVWGVAAPQHEKV